MNSTELCAAAGITYRQLDYWTRVGYLTPATEAHGSGSQRKWDSSMLFKAKQMARLTKAGLLPVTADALVRYTPGNVARVARMLEAVQ